MDKYLDSMDDKEFEITEEEKKWIFINKKMKSQCVNNGLFKFLMSIS